MVAITEFISVRTLSYLSNFIKACRSGFVCKKLVHEHRFLVWCVCKGDGIRSIARALCNSIRKVNLF